MKPKKCYAVVSKKDGKLLLYNSALPIFHLKKVADDIAKKFTGYYVKSCELTALTDLINFGAAKQNPK